MKLKVEAVLKALQDFSNNSKSINRQTLLFNSPLGMMEIVGTDTHVHSVYFQSTPLVEKTVTSSPLIQCAEELEAYFAGALRDFKVPLLPAGSDFQLQVWKELLRIPYGETISYLQLSRKLGNEKVIRAAANANGKNPIAIMIPCHRVVGTNGKLTGYAGGLWRKDTLLRHEAKVCGKLQTLF